MAVEIKSATEKKKSKVNERKRDPLLKAYKKVRSFSHKLAEPLAIEDHVIQSMPDVSPTKWHLAHTSWFFETFILGKVYPDYKSIDPQYDYLFNSYYVQVGDRHCRPKRGLISRPTVEEVHEFRKYVDRHMEGLFDEIDEKTFSKVAPVIEIGIHHEQQHQELILTDIKHVFSENPLDPIYSKGIKEPSSNQMFNTNWISFEEGIYAIGNDKSSFGYDNEFPRHKAYTNSFEISSRLVTNGEFLEFINDGGYEKTEIWLSDGWNTVFSNNWKSPLYWYKKDGEWWTFTLNGVKKLNPNEPVCHVSFYEAEAFARWAGARLPSEFEWEIVSEGLEVKGNFVDNGNFHPVVGNTGKDPQQMYGDVWEWTRSPYSPYPGYKAAAGALGEYNGKFMCNQMVLRGGSCATSKSHIRNTYRNFFPPDARWQFMGIRLAKDA